MDDLCRNCGTELGSGDRYVHADGPSLHPHCSESCLRRGVRKLRALRWADRRQRARKLLAGLTLASTGFMPHPGPVAPAKAAPASAAIVHKTEVPKPETYGPHWPPTDADWKLALAEDAWIHPLPGPIRRMPIRDSRVFGAERPHDSPVECRHGHCGVDLGGEIWGEHVFCAHDGVVDRVQRGPNDQHGGMYVKIAHRGGTVFTWYFHLAAIPRWVEPGVQVKAGDVIGLLGDSGVKESTAHLHFAVSVRPSSEWPETYMDPEPLIALWPLKVPIDNVTGLVTTMGPAAVPLGMAPPKHAMVHHAQARKRPPAAAAKPEKADAEPASADPSE